jgi:hypothetical protein
MRKKDIILLAAALLAMMMLMAAILDCGGTGNVQAGTSGGADFEVPFSIDPEKKAGYVMGRVQDWEQGEDLHAERSITESNNWISKAHVQLGFSTDTVPVSRQGKKSGWFGLKTRQAQSVMEESNSLYIPLGRSKTGDFVYALPRVKLWFE